MHFFQVNFWKNLWRESGLGEGDRLNCMFDGFLCMHLSIDLNDRQCCCATVCECLCIRHSACCLRGAPFQKVGWTTNNSQGEYCRLTFPCCDCALMPPRLLCGRASQFFCVYNSGAFPLHEEYLAEPVCAYYFVSCWPRPGCCVPPPRSRALDKILSVGVEHMEALGSKAPNQAEMDRNSLELLKRKNSDDGQEYIMNDLPLDDDGEEESFRQRKNHEDGMENMVIV